jgi:hypothetical protein
VAVLRITVHNLYLAKKERSTLQAIHAKCYKGNVVSLRKDCKEWDSGMLILAAVILIFPVDFICNIRDMRFRFRIGQLNNSTIVVCNSKDVIISE